MREKIAYVAETPLQVFYVIRMQSVTSKGASVRDMFIGLEFADANVIADKVRETGLFNHVFTYVPEKKDINPFQKMYYIAKPMSRVESMLVDEVEPEYLGDYSVVFMSHFLRFSAALRFLNKQGKTIFYDDGIGSYGDEIFSLGESGKRKLAYGLFGFDFDAIAPEAIYLNSPGFAKYSSNSVEKRKIPAETDEALARIVGDVFEVRGIPDFASHRLAYFTQPIADGPLIARAIKSTDDVVLTSGVDAIVRRHPREPQAPLGKLALDDSGTLWEVAAERCISDESVLLTVFSTALFVPKLSCDKEPRLIFTYKFSYKDEAAAGIDERIERLRAQYRNPSKVMTPESEEELKEVLLTYCG
jgi:hypothetical protein